MRDHSTIMCHRESRVGRRSFSTKVWLDLLGNCIFVVNSRKVAEASSLRAAAGSRCHFVPPNCAKVTHQKSARRAISSRWWRFALIRRYAHFRENPCKLPLRGVFRRSNLVTRTDFFASLAMTRSHLCGVATSLANTFFRECTREGARAPLY